jgi:uncharacterized protein
MSRKAKPPDPDRDLLAAAEANDAERVRALLAAGASAQARDAARDTALHRAAAAGHDALARLLLESGARPEAKNRASRTPLMLAARRGHLAAVRVLLWRGAGPNARGRDGETALGLAAGASWYVPPGQEAAVVAAGAFEPGGEDWPQVPMPVDRVLPVVQALLASGADPDAADAAGWTPLMKAARQAQAAALRSMLASGADASLKDNAGQTAAEIARLAGHVELASLLRQAERQARLRKG